MYLLYAPPEKFGLLPPGHALISSEVRFYKNVAFCPKFYWKKIHVQNKCRDISPRMFVKLRYKREMFNLIVFATGGLGDSLWIMPFARMLREKWVKSTILIVCDKRSGSVWQNVPYINGVVENLFWNVTGLLSKADEAFDFGGIATFLKKEMRSDPVEASFKMAGFALPKEKEKCRPKLICTIDEGKIAEAYLKKKGVDVKKDHIIAIGVEASTANRCWPFEFTKDLTKVLIEEGFKVLWLGKTEEYKDKYLDEETKSIGAINLIGLTGVREVIAVISLCDLFIGPNSGLMVIAASLVIPTVALFGSFNPKLRCKFYERFEALWGRFKCAPCNEHWTECRHGHPAPCMKMILPSDVYSVAKRMLEKFPRSLIEKLPIE